MTTEQTRDTRILRSVEAPDSSWWGYAHAEPTNTGPRPPLWQLVPTHVALRGKVPPELLSQQIPTCGDHCPCGGSQPVATVPVDAAWPAGTKINWDTLGHCADAYADAG